MRILKHWARETVSVTPPGERHPFDVEVCGGSERDLDDARNQALAVAERVRAAISSGRPPQRYLYSDRPLREEILEELTVQGDLAAVVTRNSYGSRILNTAGAMFIDIDMEGHRDIMTGKSGKNHPWFTVSPKEPPPGFWNKIKDIFADDSSERREEAFQSALVRIQEETARHSGLGIRVYRTYGGYRCLVTNRTFDPRDSQSRRLLERFQSDALYIKLCEVQQCYRARLTPKYWRMNGTPPPARFPFRNHKEEERYRRWQQRYEQGISSYTTCTFVGSFGSSSIEESVQPIVELHDRIACTTSEELA